MKVLPVGLHVMLLRFQIQCLAKLLLFKRSFDDEATVSITVATPR
jgi:hypothetical protein